MRLLLVLLVVTTDNDSANSLRSVLWLIMCRVLHRNQVCRRFNWLSKVPVPVGAGVCCPSIQWPAQLCKAPMFIVCAGKLRENHLLSCVSTFKQGAQTDRETRRPKEKQTLPSKQLVSLSLSLSKAVAVKQENKQADRQTDRTSRKCGLNISKSFIYQHH